MISIIPIRVRRVTCSGAAFVASSSLLLASCGDALPDQRSSQCVSVTTEPIVNGVADPEPLGVDSHVLRAIGSIENADGEVICTGTLVAEQLVLTARHCDRTEGLFFRTNGRDHAAMRVPIVRSHKHASLDVMLAQIDAANAMKLASIVAPAPLAPMRDAASLVLAGAGETEARARGALLFARGRVLSTSATEIVVDAEGSSGACSGDSGGPLLDVTESATRVVGVLSHGSADCRGSDSYVRSDAIDRWREHVIAEVLPRECADQSFAGSCTPSGPRWCQDGRLRGGPCTGKFVCGFDRMATRYRCLNLDEDGCPASDAD